MANGTQGNGTQAKAHLAKLKVHLADIARVLKALKALRGK